MNPKTLELRNLLGKGPEGVKCCSICGKPHARAAKDVKELPHHKAALAENLPEQFRTISRYLDVATPDFVSGGKFNAQLESIRTKLTLAREEHDAYTPVEHTTTASAGLREILMGMLRLLGVDMPLNPEPKSEGLWSPTFLAATLQVELLRLMAIKKEVETMPTHGGDVGQPTPVLHGLSVKPESSEVLHDSNK